MSRSGACASVNDVTKPPPSCRARNIPFSAGLQHGFDVDNRRLVDRFHVSHAAPQAVDRKNLDDVHAQRVRPVGRPGGEHAMEGPAGVSARMHLSDVAVGEMQPGDHDDVVADLQTVERRSHVRVEHQPAVGDPSSPWHGAASGSDTGDSTRPIDRRTRSSATYEISMRTVTSSCLFTRMGK